MILEFLITIAEEIDPYSLPVEPAFNRLNRYIDYRQKILGECLVKQLKNDLINLNNNSVFRFLCHGELRTGNIVLDSFDKNFIIIDWPQAYIGHPLIDWWMYIYWDKKPKSFSNAIVPKELLFGITSMDLQRLYRVWVNLYK